jgi:predicted nuclease with RNAse H fold
MTAHPAARASAVSTSEPWLSVGIDLAAQNAKTAVCVIEWHSDRAVARGPYVGPKGDEDGWIIDLARGAQSIGIDAPFGWPDAIVQALPIWANEGRWTSAKKLDLRFRLTDQIVAEATGRAPLSVSSDRIAVTAWRCARLLDQLRPNSGRPLSRIGGDGIYEVYPGAALTRWEFNRVGYKSSGSAAAKQSQRSARIALVHEIRHRATWLDLDAIEDHCHDSDDALDAVLAALVARAARMGLTREPESVDESECQRVAREGWIHLPRDRETFAHLLQSQS